MRLAGPAGSRTCIPSRRGRKENHALCAGCAVFFVKMATGLDPESVAGARGCNDVATRVFKDSLVDLTEGIQVGKIIPIAANFAVDCETVVGSVIFWNDISILL